VSSSAAITSDATAEDTRETKEKSTRDSYFAAFALTVGLSLADAAGGTGANGPVDFASSGRGSVTVTAGAGKHRPFGGQNADGFTGVPSTGLQGAGASSATAIPANPEPGEWMILGMISASIVGLMLRARLRTAARSGGITAA
jgi:hypothetical protein